MINIDGKKSEVLTNWIQYPIRENLVHYDQVSFITEIQLLGQIMKYIDIMYYTNQCIEINCMIMCFHAEKDC